MTKLEYIISWCQWRISDIHHGWWKVQEAYKVWKLIVVQKFPHGEIWDYLGN